MTAIESRQKLHRQIDQLLPEQLKLLAEFLDFLQFKRSSLSPANLLADERQPGLHPGVFTISDDFDEPLGDSFWLGEE